MRLSPDNNINQRFGKKIPMIISMTMVMTMIIKITRMIIKQVTSEALTSVWLGPLPSIIINCPTLAREEKKSVKILSH